MHLQNCVWEGSSAEGYHFSQPGGGAVVGSNVPRLWSHRWTVWIPGTRIQSGHFPEVQTRTISFCDRKIQSMFKFLF